MTTFLCAFFLFYLWHALGVTVGYHRLLAHRTFKSAKFAEYFWVLGGYLCFEGSPIWWATVHRNHHRFTDEKRDPHAPKYGVSGKLKVCQFGKNGSRKVCHLSAGTFNPNSQF